MRSCWSTPRSLEQVSVGHDTCSSYPWFIVAGLSAGSLAVFIAGTVVGGFGVGLVYGASLASTNQLAPPEHRSQFISTYFVAANLGLIISVIGVGVASQHIGNLDATLICASAITALVVLALVNIARSRRPHPIVDAQSPRQRSRETWRQ